MRGYKPKWAIHRHQMEGWKLRLCLDQFPHCIVEEIYAQKHTRACSRSSINCSKINIHNSYPQFPVKESWDFRPWYSSYITVEVYTIQYIQCIQYNIIYNIYNSLEIYYVFPLHSIHLRKKHILSTLNIIVTVKAS